MAPFSLQADERISAKKKYRENQDVQLQCFELHLSIGYLAKATNLAIQCKSARIPVISTLHHYCSYGVDSAEVSHLLCVTDMEAGEFL